VVLHTDSNCLDATALPERVTHTIANTDVIAQQSAPTAQPADRGIAALVEIGSRIGVPYWIMALADAQRHAGALADAFATVEHTLEFNNAELAYRPESLGVRGEIRLKLRDSDQAESDFRDSIALAQRMQAKAWELRSTMSFALVLARQGRRDEALAALAEIYNWFTEGFDTADLKEAKALLVELSC